MEEVYFCQDWIRSWRVGEVENGFGDLWMGLGEFIYYLR